MHSGTRPAATKIEPAVQEELARIVKKWKDKRGSLIMVLHDVEERYGYVPRNCSLVLAKMLSVPVARIYEVITFYNYFKLEAPGKNVISVCMGTACYLKGAPQILEKISAKLGIKPGESTKDGEYHLQEVRCLGCCGLAPVLTSNGTIHPKVKPDEAVAKVCACAAAGKPTCHN